MKALFLFMSLAFSAPAFSQLDSAGSQQAKVFTFVEDNPNFPGGNVALMKFLSENLRYPLDEDVKNKQGLALVRFVVNEDGSVSDVKVVRSVDPERDADAIRVVKSLPKFIPGRQQGKLVKVYFNIPIRFKL
jgi:protein TonB